MLVVGFNNVALKHFESCYVFALKILRSLFSVSGNWGYLLKI
jgi:hypothetical protein